MTNKYTKEGLPIITLEAINQHGREMFCDSISSLNKRNSLFFEQIATTNPYVSFYMNRCLDNIDNNHFWLFVHTGMSGLYRLMQIQEEINRTNKGVSTHMNETADIFTGNEKLYIYDTVSGLYRLMQIQAEMDKKE